MATRIAAAENISSEDAALIDQFNERNRGRHPDDIVIDPIDGKAKRYGDMVARGEMYGLAGDEEEKLRVANFSRNQQAADDAAREAKNAAALSALQEGLSKVSYDVSTPDRQMPNVKAVNRQTASGAPNAPSYQKKMEGMSGARRKV